jgi:glutaminyl-tRNA synthetase
MEPGASTEVPKEGGLKETSKRALDKAKKKAEKAAKKAEYAIRPKEEKPAAASAAASAEPKEAASVFTGGWLKKVYEEKPIAARTRFPPEPNGYLHIGHAKAIFTNFGFAEHHKGICFLRFDDTNPEKEEAIYFEKIQEIIAWLGYKPYEITYSSDHFDKLYELAEELIRRDKAYVCTCTKEEVNLQRGGPDNRGARFGCAHRSRPTEESLAEFRAMRDGKYERGTVTLRMKQKLTDPTEGNPQMWDLAAYRVLNKPHPRTGDKWKIYPTYDYTHCLCDAFEEISHSMCTTEFYLSRTSYDWLLEQLDFKLVKSDEKGPMQREYGRLVLEGTILSKRRIAALVHGATFDITKEDGTTESKTVPPVVDGWDDPRLYTLVAIRRRGVPASAIRQFVSELGITDANSVIRANRFDFTVRKELERSVPRLHLVLDPVKVIIEELADDFSEDLNIPYDPKNPAAGSRVVPLSKVIYIDRSDFREEDDKDFFRLAPGKAVGLLNVPFKIEAKSFEKDASGNIIEIKAVKVESAAKPKAYIHWVGAKNVKVEARQYNALFSVEDPNELDWKFGGYADKLNPKSVVSWVNALVEPAFLDLKKEHVPTDGASDNLCRFQAVRTGYFCIDPKLEGDKIVLNQIVSLKEDKGKGN